MVTVRSGSVAASAKQAYRSCRHRRPLRRSLERRGYQDYFLLLLPAMKALKALAAILLFAIVVAFLASRTLAHLHVLGDADNPSRWGLGDFRDVIYFPTRAVLDGVNPYDSAPTDDPQRYHGRYPVGNVFPV